MPITCRGRATCTNAWAGKLAIGENIRVVQATFKKLYNPERSFLPDGSQFDHLFKDGETFMIGVVQATAMLVPGHTPADMAYLIDGSVFVGDTLFMPDVGSARADFPDGDVHRRGRRIPQRPGCTVGRDRGDVPTARLSDEIVVCRCRRPSDGRECLRYSDAPGGTSRSDDSLSAPLSNWSVCSAPLHQPTVRWRAAT